MLSLGLGQAEEQLSPDLSFVIQNNGPNFRAVFRGVVVVLVLLVVTGVKQSQLGLGLDG